MADKLVLTTMEEVDALERDIERLRVLYKQYFMGSLKREPLTLRKKCYRLVLQARPGNVTNTAVRFRLRSTLQKWNSNLTYWQRITRQMEDGTYEPALNRVRRRRKERQAAAAADAAPAAAADEARAAPETHTIAEDLSDADLQRQLEAAVAAELATQAPTPAAAAPTPPAQVGVGADAEERFRELVVQRQAAGLSVEGLSLSDVQLPQRDPEPPTD